MEKIKEITNRVEKYFDAIKEENIAIDDEEATAWLELLASKTEAAGNNFYSHAPDDVRYLLQELTVARGVARSALAELKFQTSRRICVFCDADSYDLHSENCPFNTMNKWEY